MSAADYEKGRYLAGMEVARQCVQRLREHFEAVTLNVSYSDTSGTSVALELEWCEDDDEDDDEKDKKP